MSPNDPVETPAVETPPAETPPAASVAVDTPPPAEPPVAPPVPARGFLRRHAKAVGLLAVLLAAGGYWVAEEIETSRFQATQLAAYTRGLSFQVLKGPSEAIR